MSTDEPGEAEVSALEALGRALKEEPRMRHFDRLGWTVILLPVDLLPSRVVASVFLGTMHGYPRDDIHELRARRIRSIGEPDRVWWVFAVPRRLTRSLVS